MSLEALTYIEIDVDYCSLTYGTAPCTASVPTTGAQKCFNTRASCQDTANFTNSPVTLRFAVDTGHNPSDIEALPFIRNHSDVAITPGRISLGEDLGQRESVSITLEDRPHPDVGPGYDKYLADRSYTDPSSQGSYWSKFRARQPYLKGRPCRVYRGFVGQALADMECRHYIIDSYQGPGTDGRYQIVAKDILKLLDGDIAQAPALSLGSLSGSVSVGGSSLTLTPAGIGDSNYPTSGKANIGGTEIVSFTRSGDTVTITSHSLNGTTDAGHSAGERFQICLEYTSQDPADIVYDLMATYGGVSTSYLPHSTWQTETGTYNRRLYTGIIAEPTSVRTLIQEMIQQAGLAIWWDPIDQQVNLQVLRAVTADAQTFDETLMLGDSPLVIAEQPDKRVSRVIVYYGQRNPLLQQDLPSNYRSSVVTLDTTAESNWGTPAIQTIYSRWIAFGGLTTAQRIGNLQLGRYVNPPRKFTFSTIRAENGGLILGAGYYLQNRSIQNFDGTLATVPFQVTRINSQADRQGIEAQENVFVSYDASDSLTVTIDAAIRSINLKTLYDALYTAPLAGDVVTFNVNAGVVVGANNTSGPAMDTGTWPSTTFTATRSTSNGVLTGISDTSAFKVGQAITGSGIPNNARITSIVVNTSVTIDKTPTISGSASLTLWTAILKLVVEGQVIGAGGVGGFGQHADNSAGVAGSPGGTGLKVTSPIELSGAGKIDGGGGGGGSGASDYAGVFGPWIDGSGGGGGAGDAPGSGGYIQGSASGAAAGSTGSLNSGGAGGSGGFAGGAGGSPGSAGGAGTANGNGNSGGFGGAGGLSVDGVSLLKSTAFTGAFRGSQA